MEITTSVTVPDYVYLFFQKAADELQLPKPETLMAQALIYYVGILAQKISEDHDLR